MTADPPLLEGVSSSEIRRLLQAIGIWERVAADAQPIGTEALGQIPPHGSNFAMRRTVWEAVRAGARLRSSADLRDLYRDFYAGEPFVEVSDTPVTTVNTQSGTSTDRSRPWPVLAQSLVMVP